MKGRTKDMSGYGMQGAMTFEELKNVHIEMVQKAEIKIKKVN
jgi:hypothetical protein